MKSAKFKYIDRGCKDSIVFIPGWASDYRIFRPLNLDFNYIYPIDFSPFTFEKNLLEMLKRNKIKKISLFGWSLGGFVAAGFAGKHKDIIDELILVSIRMKYSNEEITLAKKNLKRNKKSYLYKFYTQCFPDKERMRYVRENLLKDYCERFSLNYLLITLGYLENAEIEPSLLKEIEKIKIVHSQFDTIAPIEEAIAIKNILPQAIFINIKDEGHIPFLREDFNTLIC